MVASLCVIREIEVNMTSRVIVITSGKGGVGKTTTTANLGAALAIKGRRVLVIDGDIGLRNLDVIMGLENRIVFNLVDVVKGVCKPQQAIIKSKCSNNLFLLPASQTDDKSIVTPEEMRELIGKLRTEYHFILIDCPAGIEQGFKNACAAADEAIIVTTPEVTALRDADRVIGLLSAESIEPQVLINRVDKDMVRKGDMLSPEDVIDILGIEQIGLVLKDNDIIIAANKGEPVVYTPRSKAGKAFCAIADRLTGTSVERADLSLATTGIWSRLSRAFGAA